MKTYLPIIAFIYIWFLILPAQDIKTAPKRTYYATKLSTVPPKIDGHINDDAWKSLAWADSFVQLNPIEQNPPSERTAFKILYGEKNLYCALFCYDSEPEKITAQLSRRDDVEESDFIALGIDSYFDKRTGFVFGINAGGVKMDMIFSDDGDGQDDSWDPVWEGKVSVNDSGWIAEMRIPYSQLRFADKEEQVWGFQILRKIHRKQEEDIWQFISKDAPGFISYFGILRGIMDIKMPPRVEILPYSVFSYKTYEKESGNPFAKGTDASFNAGLDGKIGITSNLTMDFTVNPDFGQVEADPSEVNLSAYESFFEEKRPFFIEGKNIFSFPIAMGDGDMSAEQLFYSRRIGRRPHYYPDEDDGFNYDYVDQPSQTRILGAAKVSGKTANGWSIGLLDAVTDKEVAQLDLDHKKSDITVEPLTNFLVSRLQKDLNGGNTSVGGMITATNRKIEDEHLDYLNKSAYTGGIDIRHQWAEKSYFVSLNLAGSHLKGKQEAILKAQEASARYFQRPDANHVKLDSSRTTLSGYGGSFNIGRSGNGNWRYATGGLWRSPGFEINDIGFMRQADQAMQYFWVGYRENNPIGIFRNFSINVNEWQGWNFNGDMLFQGGNINGGAQFLNYWSFHMGINRQQDGLTANLLRGGPMATYLGNWNMWFNFRSDSRKDWRLHGFASYNTNDDKISHRYSANLDLFYKLNEQFDVSMEPFYTNRVENLQYVDSPEIELAGENVTRYVFAKMDQNTLGLVFRINYSPIPDLSIQYFGQPFISAGIYSDFKHINNPRGKGAGRYDVYDENGITYDSDSEMYSIDENMDDQPDYEFEIPDFNVQEFLSNLVVRWEYQPGSTLYLVWSQNRDAFTNTRGLSLKEDITDLFDATPTNIFLIKMNYWFSL